MNTISVKQAVILAGGRGTRLGPLTEHTPKPMIFIHQRPFLQYLIESLRENGIEKIVLLLGYLPSQIMQYFGDGLKFGVKIEYCVGDISFETGKRIKTAQHLLEDHFLLMYCDNYWPLSLKKLLKFYNQSPTLASVTVYKNEEQATKNNSLVDDEGFVVQYDKSRTAANLNGVEIGYFILNKKILSLMDETNFSFEKEIFPKLIANRQLRGFLTNHKYYSIGKMESLPLTQKYLENRKSILLDRDGVINKKAPQGDYVKTWEEFEFLPGAIDAIKMLTDAGYDIYLITNQGGIARQKMEEKNLHQIHEKMQAIFHQHKTGIKAIYYCPHGWDDGCPCRKPKPGMLFQAARDHQINLTKTTFIGDDERDIEAGQAADMQTILVTEENTLLKMVQKMVGIS